MLDDVKSHGLWERTAPSAPQTERLRGTHRADVVVIGAGFTGLSTALHLAVQGAKVTVLETVAPGFGGSGRNVGLVNAGMWLPPDQVCEAIGRDSGERLLSVLGGAPALVFDIIQQYGIDCEAVRNGTLHCAANAAGVKDLEARAAQWQKRGAPVEMLDAAETRRRLGSAAYHASLLDRRAGTVQPLAYARGLARVAIASGATIFSDSEVLSAQRSGTEWVLRTADGAVTAPWVVVATNAYSGNLWPTLPEEFVRLPYYQCATQPLSEAQLSTILPGQEGTWDTRTVMRSLRRDASGRLIFGGVGALRNGADTVHRSFSKRVLGRMYPALGDIRLEHEWFGWIAMTEDNLPRYHELAPNVLNFHGYNGRGIGTGTMFGKVLANRILGRDGDLPLPAVAEDRVAFRGIKAATYELGAVLAHAV